MAACAIRRRAAEVRRPGTYVGLFEWVVWGELQTMDIVMLFESPVNIRDFVGSSLPPLAAEKTCYVMAVRLTSAGGMLVPGLCPGQQANHYVWAATASATCSRPASVAGSDALTAARRWGWLPKKTNATGECGPDAMAAAVDLQRSAAGWRAVRRDIADFMESVSHDEIWQDVFACCAEGAFTEPPPSAAGASGQDICTLPPPLPPPVDDEPDPLSPRPLESLGSATAVERAVEHGQASSQAGGEARASASPLAAAPGVSSQPRPSFPDWLRALPDAQLQEATQNIDSMTAAEATWRKLHPPVRPEPRRPRPHRQQVKLNIKLAMGEAYLRWIASQGAASRAPQREPRCKPCPLAVFRARRFMGVVWL
jgi:hypothetical protein